MSQNIQETVPAQPVSVAAQPPSYPQEKIIPAAPVAAAATANIVADNAIASDAIRMTYLQYITIPDVKKYTATTVPEELAKRGLTQADFVRTIDEVKEVKKKSDTNKILLWTGCIFFCGIIGYLLVAQRAVGNKHLRKQLENPLEDANRRLMNGGVPVRWLWVDGSLRAYYK